MTSNLADPFPAIVKITDLVAATTVTGAELLEAVQYSGSVQLSINQIFSTINASMIVPIQGALMPQLGGTGQLLAKSSAQDYSTAWTNLGDAVVAGTGLSKSGSTTVTVALASAAALSVLGVTGASAGTSVPISGTAAQVLRVNDAGNALAFGAVNLGSTAAVTGQLPVASLSGVLPTANGGMGFTTAVASSLVGWLTTTTLTAYAVGQLPGIATAVDAAAGNIGQYLASSLVFGSAKALTDGVATSVISLALTPGDWDVSCTLAFTGQTSTLVYYAAGSLSDSSTVLNTTLGESISIPGFHLAMFTSTAVVNTPTFGFPVVRRSLSTTTTQWLTAQMAFTTSTASVYGAITARRVR